MKGQSKEGFRQEEGRGGLVQTGSMEALTELERQDLYSQSDMAHLQMASFLWTNPGDADR